MKQSSSSKKHNGGRGILSFFLGMIMGIVLFVGAIAGTIYALIATVKVGEITDFAGLEDGVVFDEGADINNKTLLQIYQMLAKEDFPNMTLGELAEKYGLNGKLDLASDATDFVDISVLYDVPLKDLGEEWAGLILNQITLNKVGNVTGLDFTEYGLPILSENVNVPIVDAIDNILSSLSGELTLRQIEDNFGITLGNEGVLAVIKDTPISQISEVINGLKVGTIIGADNDKFVQIGVNTAYVKTERYEKVEPEEYDLIDKNAVSYICGIDEGIVLERELRFVQKTAIDENGEEYKVFDGDGSPVFVVDNSCYNMTEEDEGKEYYRYYEYEAYQPNDMPATGAFYVKAYGNHFVDKGFGYELVEEGFVPLAEIYADENGSPFTTAGSTVLLEDDIYHLVNDKLEIAEKYGIDPFIHTIDSSTLLSNKYTGYARVHIGSADPAVQVLSHLTVGALENSTDDLKHVKLGDILEITESSAHILQVMKDTSIIDISMTIESLLLSDLIEITPSLYTEDPNGDYVFLTLPTDKYVEYNELLHAGETKYVLKYVEDEKGRFVLKDNEYFYYDENDPALVGLTRYSDRYYPATGSEPQDTVFYAHKEGGYYTLYHPDYGTEVTRYTKQTTPEEMGKFRDYILATDLEIANSAITKYYWNGTEMVAGVVSDKPLYVAGIASSKVIQRLASSIVRYLGPDFEHLILGDVIDIDPDIYAVAGDTSDTSVKYYYDANGVFLEAKQEFIAENPDMTFYTVTSEGTSHIVMKMLAYLPVTKVGERMESIINELYLEDLITIYENNVVEEDTDYIGEAGEYFTPYDSDFDQVVDGETFHYAYIPDVDGKYYLREYDFVKLTEEQAKFFAMDDEGMMSATMTFYYQVRTTTAASTLQDILTTGNGYFKDDQGNFHHNPALCAYILTRYLETVAAGGTETPAGFDCVYIMSKYHNGSSATGPSAIVFSNRNYNGVPMLYVNILGQYIPYDSESRMHSTLDKYLLVTEGYTLADETNSAGRQLYYFDKTTNTFTTDSTNSLGLTFVKNSPKANDGTKDLYYYVALDSKYTDDVNNGIMHTTYSKHLAETTYVKVDEADATHVLVDGKIYDLGTMPNNATDTIFLKEEIGCIFTIEDQSEVSSVLALLDPATIKINYIQKQSVAALRAFAEHDVKVGGLNDAVNNFTVNDMINIAPDTMFDDAELRNAKINELSTIFQGRIKNMTIKNILDWGNITTLDDDVYSIIGDATLEDFFAALSYENGDIHVDIVVLYINIYARQNATA